MVALRNVMRIGYQFSLNIATRPRTCGRISAPLATQTVCWDLPPKCDGASGPFSVPPSVPPFCVVKRSQTVELRTRPAFLTIVREPLILLGLMRKEMVGPTRFELVTFCTPSKRATRLRYGPTVCQIRLVAGAGFEPTTFRL